MGEGVHFDELILAADLLGDVLLYALEEKLILFLLDARDGEFAEYFVDCFELA